MKQTPERNYIPMAERFHLLRRMDTRRRWKGLDDERVCLLCERRFAGRHLEFRRSGSGEVQLQCPTDGCKATMNEWVYVDDPRLTMARHRRTPVVFGLTVQTGTA